MRGKATPEPGQPLLPIEKGKKTGEWPWAPLVWRGGDTLAVDDGRASCWPCWLPSTVRNRDGSKLWGFSQMLSSRWTSHGLVNTSHPFRMARVSPSV